MEPFAGAGEKPAWRSGERGAFDPSLDRHPAIVHFDAVRMYPDGEAAAVWGTGGAGIHHFELTRRISW